MPLGDHQAFEEPAFEEIVGDARSGLLLIADHAGRRIPPPHGTLGLPASELERHIAHDIGIEALTRALARRLAAPAVMARFSRLFIDANRGEDDPTLIRSIYDRTIIPGNIGLGAAERAARITGWHRCYQDAVTANVDACWQAAGAPPLIVSLHSFTPQLAGGALRPWHVGLLADADRRATDLLLARLRAEDGLIIGDNEPYDGALKGDTLYQQASRRGIAHLLIELRQDLIADARGAEDWAARLAPHLAVLAAEPDLHNVRRFGSRAGGLPVDPPDTA
jgi:predicted N-formylglutamate amidohydrolase